MVLSPDPKQVRDERLAKFLNVSADLIRGIHLIEGDKPFLLAGFWRQEFAHFPIGFASGGYRGR
jgi:hypothetical protein